MAGSAGVAVPFGAMPASVYEDRGGTLYATELARGPWDPDAQHGGAPAAMIVRALERTAESSELALARVTVELRRPVPLGELLLGTELIRPGKRVQLIDASLRTPDGTEVLTARSLWIAKAGVDGGPVEQPPPGPETAKPIEFVGRVGAGREELLFPRDAMEIRFVSGAFSEIGPATAWFRLRVPLVAGEQPSPLQRLAAAADFPNGIASMLPWEDFMFINPDLTIYVEREPVGEWICLDARMSSVADGVGLSQAVLYDRNGRVGRSLQSLLIMHR